MFGVLFFGNHAISLRAVDLLIKQSSKERRQLVHKSSPALSVRLGPPGVFSLWTIPSLLLMPGGVLEPQPIHSFTQLSIQLATFVEGLL